MSENVGGVVIIAAEDSRECSVCHAWAECRPYTADGSAICFKCASATPESKRETVKHMNRVLFREPQP